MARERICCSVGTRASFSKWHRKHAEAEQPPTRCPLRKRPTWNSQSQTMDVSCAARWRRQVRTVRGFSIAARCIGGLRTKLKLTGAGRTARQRRRRGIRVSERLAITCGASSAKDCASHACRRPPRPRSDRRDRTQRKENVAARTKRKLLRRQPRPQAEESSPLLLRLAPDSAKNLIPRDPNRTVAVKLVKSTRQLLALRRCDGHSVRRGGKAVPDLLQELQTLFGAQLSDIDCVHSRSIRRDMMQWTPAPATA